MRIDYDVAMDMQKICTGEPRTLSRGQIAGQVIDIDQVTKDFSREKADACVAFYNKMAQDQAQKLYDADMLVAETASIKAEFGDFLECCVDDGSFQDLFDSISGFFMTPPFEGLDHIEYGVNEACVFSILEYFRWKTGADSDHAKVRAQYRESIASRTYEEVADHWIGVYDDLQKRYDALGADFDGVHALQQKLASCCILAIAAIRDQDGFALDMVQSGAAEKGKAIMDAYLGGTYEEGESAFTDNVIKLYQFVYGQING